MAAWMNVPNTALTLALSRRERGQMDVGWRMVDVTNKSIHHPKSTIYHMELDVGCVRRDAVSPSPVILAGDRFPVETERGGIP